MITTIPFKAAPGLDTPVTDVMHHGYVALPATATLVDAARAMRDNVDAITEPAASIPPTAALADAMTLFVATGASHILVAASDADADAEAAAGVVAESDLVAFMAR